MSTAVLTNRLEFSSIADTALKAATRFWFGVTVIGQLIFAFAVASFYGMTAMRGDYHGWNFSTGYIPGVTKANWAVVTHLASAVFVMLAGAVQLVPQVRNRFPAFHRWNGRLYMLAGVTVGTAGFYMTWFRSGVGDVWQHIGSTGNALLIWVCGVMALRYALARNFKAHRPWALRFFLVVSASWFIRIMLFLTFLILSGALGFDPSSLTTRLLTIMTFAQYVVPLAVLEVYLRAKDHPGAFRRLATAGLLFVVTLGMCAGLFAVTAGIWVGQVKAAFDPRRSIAETLSATITASGIDAAIQQYHELKVSAPATYNFDENELNSLGYKLLRTSKFKDAIRIFQLNVEVFPKSSNVYDSLGEGYMDNGDKAPAIANYKKSLELNPKNANAESMLRKLNAQ